MHSRVILISDDIDFFHFLIPELSLRISDEVLCMDFSQISEIVEISAGCIVLINSENNKERTLELLDIINNSPIIVFDYNENKNFKINAFKKGIFAYITLNTDMDDILAQLLPVLNLTSILNINEQYRSLLVKNQLINKFNEVYLDYKNILDIAIEKFDKKTDNATLVAISAQKSNKYKINTNLIETVILNTVRKDDILMNVLYGKYLLLLNNADENKSKTVWNKIKQNIPYSFNVSFTQIKSKNREKIINECFSKLYSDINANNNLPYNLINSDKNFKLFKQDFAKKMELVITPVFYQIQQIYSDKLKDVNIKQVSNAKVSTFSLESKNSAGTFQISTAGYAVINIDIKYTGNIQCQPKRISLRPEEFEQGLLSDLLEEFILEYKSLNNGEEDDNA